MTKPWRNPVADAIARDMSDQGRLIEAGWVCALRVLQWADRPEAERNDLRLAFYAGAQHAFGSLVGMLDGGDEPTLDDMRRIENIAEELNSFARELMALLDAPEGRS